MSTCSFLLPQNMATFAHFPPRECLYREADFCIFFDPKKPFLQLIGRLLNFGFSIANTMRNFRQEKEIKKRKTHRFLACLSGNNNNNNNNTLGVT
jgi:hypothetical protein